MTFGIKSLILISILCISGFLFAQHENKNQENKILTPEMVGIEREKINFSDRQLRLFNGRGAVYPRQYSVTGLQILQFPPVDLPDYQFRFDFYDVSKNLLIQDNVPDIWKTWIETGRGSDPLGCNFRPGFATVLISQEEYWQPNCYFRRGTFHKENNGHLTSFSIETKSSVSAKKDEIFLEIIISNRDDEPLNLTLIPTQTTSKLQILNENIETKTKSPFCIGNEQLKIYLASDLKSTNEKGWEFKIQPNKTEKAYFVIIPLSTNEKTPDIFQPDIKNRMDLAYYDSRDRLQYLADRLPSVSTSYKKFDDFYKRTIMTLSECKWTRDNFITNPFWACGTWIFTMTWDNSFTADILTMIDPKSMKDIIFTGFKEGQLKRSYISWQGASGNIPYIQDPFASLILIEAYIRQTGDFSLLDQKTGDTTVYGWMKRWGRELHDNYGREEDGMIDMGESTEKLVEIRTDGYSHIVPVVNGLTIDLYGKLAGWGEEKKDHDAKIFQSYATQLSSSFHKKLWNEQEGWFDNLYPNGTRNKIWTYHLFDLLGTNILSEAQAQKMISHIKEGEFLGKFGMYSISKKDRIHWDMIDGDWGGGGQYPGMPLRIIEHLYKRGYSELGWNIFDRFMNYIDYFPYIPQNPGTDRPQQDESSMPLQISAGAGLQVVIFSIFGFQPKNDGTLEIFPSYHHELGSARISDFKFRGNSYDMEMNSGKFKVFRNGKLLGNYFYGERLFVDKKTGEISTLSDKKIANPIAKNYKTHFVHSLLVEFKCKTSGSEIRYSTEGDPDSLSQLYTGPIKITETTTFRLKAFKNEIQSSDISEITFYKNVFKDKTNPGNIINRIEFPDIKLSLPLSRFHPVKNGEYAIMDGIYGSDMYNDEKWIGYEGSDLEINVDLKSVNKINKISIRFLKDHGVWIFLPKEIQYSTSKDGKTFNKSEIVKINIPDRAEPTGVESFASLINSDAQFICIRIEGLKTCPTWHPGAGGKAWFFIDEIVIE